MLSGGVTVITHLLNNNSLYWVDYFNGTNGDPPSSDWNEAGTPVANKFEIQNNAMYFSASKPAEQSSSTYISDFQMDKSQSWTIEATMNLIDIAAQGDQAGGQPYMTFGYTNAAGTPLHTISYYRLPNFADPYGGAMVYDHYTGNHRGYPDGTSTKLKAKIRWFGPEEPSYNYKSILWVWSNLRTQWEWDPTIGEPTTDGITISGATNEDCRIMFSATNITGGANSNNVITCTFDNIKITEGLIA